MTRPVTPYPNRPRDRVGRLTNLPAKRRYEARQRGDIAVMEYITVSDAIVKAGI